MNQLNTIQFFNFEYVEKEKQLNEIYTFKFKPLSDFHYQAGQWIHLGFPSEKKDKSKVRHMSFSSSPTDSYLEFTMDTSSGTLFKNRMLDLKKGDIMKGFKINGNLVIPSDFNEKVIFIAGGIGITPFRSLIRNTKNVKSNLNWELLHISKNGFLFEDEFKLLPNKQWRVNRKDIDDIWDNIVKESNSKYFLCGSNRFVTGLKQRLLNSEINESQIVMEDFH